MGDYVGQTGLHSEVSYPVTAAVDGDAWILVWANEASDAPSTCFPIQRFRCAQQ